MKPVVGWFKGWLERGNIRGKCRDSPSPKNPASSSNHPSSQIITAFLPFAPRRNEAICRGIYRGILFLGADT